MALFREISLQMKDRIITLIKAKNFTAAQFADEIGVQKSGISHILSGRNNPSLDFVQKILLRFPEVNIEWLVFGKGPLFKDKKNSTETLSDTQSNDIKSRSSMLKDLFSGVATDIGKDYNMEKAIKPESDLNLEDVISKESSDTKPTSPESINQEAKTSPQPEKQIENIGKSHDEYRHKILMKKSIQKIVEFYTDCTFREFFPE